eukprot:scaffold388_cov114-Cylindrotheca_fusiformis.AAC.13
MGPSVSGRRRMDERVLRNHRLEGGKRTGYRGASFLLSVSLFSSFLRPIEPFPATYAQRKASRSSLSTIYVSADENRSSGESPAVPKKSLHQLLTPIDSCNVNQMSGTDLAYIGDSVFELYIRSRHVWPSKRTSDLQNTVVAIVRAEHQSHLLSQLKENFGLSDKEKQILMRGRNAVTKSKNRRNPAAYQDSTSFEALLGYLYIQDEPRCCDLLNWLDSYVDEISWDEC